MAPHANLKAVFKFSIKMCHQDPSTSYEVFFFCFVFLYTARCPSDATIISDLLVAEWPISDSGEEISITCPCGNITSLLPSFLQATRTCDDQGVWALPDVTICEGINVEICNLSTVRKLQGNIYPFQPSQ